MKIFQIIQRNFNAIGFSENHSKFNKHHVGFSLMSIFSIASQLVYLFNGVNSVAEYMYSFIMTIVGMGVFISFLSSISKKATLHTFIDNIQTIIDESKQRKLLFKSREKRFFQ